MVNAPNSVLVVDDEASIVRLVREFLSARGLDVWSAESGREALDLFGRVQPPVVLTDVRMPGMSGIELLHAVKVEQPVTAVIVMTGVAGEGSAVKVLRAGAAYYIRKPFRLTQLERLIRKCLSWFEPDAEPEIAYPYLETEDLEFRVPSDLAVVTPVVQFLWRRSRLALGDAWAAPFRCGLEEILINAVEHGNLGLSFEEKSGALLGDSYWDAIQERMERPELRDRLVHLGYRRDAGSVRCRVRDEGEGFDWRAWCRNGTLDRLPGASGRGIFLARVHSSRVEYNEAGNEVTITWDLGGDTRESG